VRRARLAPAMISTSGNRVLRRRQRRALPAWLPSGQTREQIPLHYFTTAHAAARARWRRCFALSLAFRLFARIVLLDFVIFFVGWSVG
jgi:hypothetical protein